MKSQRLRLILLLAVVLGCLPGYAQLNYTFTNATAEGNTGPTQAMVNTEYTGTSLDGQVTVIGGIQYWIVPTSGSYQIEAFGGQGYGPFGGRGAHISGEFNLVAGDTLKILVGQEAGHYLNYPATTYNHQYGGGGGSFVTTPDNTPLVVAGGGGGNHGTSFSTSCDGQTTTAGANGTNANTTGNGGTNGMGGAQATSADGGGGLLGDGAGTAGGDAFVNGGLGGIDEGTGGFGCGGGTSSWNNYRGGGGGGYSGGGAANNGGTCCPTGGGGGSFNAGINQANLAGVQLGHGQVIITPLETFPNDAGVAVVSGLNAPLCAGTYPVSVDVTNFGNNQINPVTVQWTVNGVAQTDTVINTLLDTAAGSGISTITVLLGNVTVNGPTTIEAWTTNPNNVNDTVNGNDTADVSITPSLEGIYTIGPSGGNDYPDFTSAVNDLGTFGVCDSVIFQVESATYNEQIVIDEIMGASSNNTITFRSAALNYTQVELTYTSTGTADNYVVRLNSADHIRFEHITVNNQSSGTSSKVFDFLSGSNENMVSDCHILNTASTSTSNNRSLIFSPNGALSHDNVFRNNLLENGSYGVYWYGASTTSLSERTVFEGNMFLNQYHYGCRIQNTDETVFRDNEMTSTSTHATGYGMYLSYSDHAIIDGNHLYSTPGSDWPQYGLYLNYNDGNLNDFSKVTNNLVVLGLDNSGTEQHYAFYPRYCDFQEYSNNTFVVKSAGSGSRAGYIFYCDYYYGYNNLFVNYSDGYAVDYHYGAGPIDLDHNAYWSPTGSFAEFGVNVQAASLEALQLASDMDFNSFEVDPMFIDTLAGVHCNDSINGGGMPLAHVVEDFYDEVRDPATPDIGAVEIVLPGDISLTNDTICGNETTLEVFGPVQNIVWSVNGTPTSGSSVLVENPTNSAQVMAVSVNYQTASCGAGTDNAQLVLVPAAHLDSNIHICADETADLEPGGGAGTTYLWTPGGETTPTITVDAIGTYTVTKDELGCQSSTSTVVTKSTAVAIDDVEFCQDALPLTLNATIPDGITYAWSGGNEPTEAVNTFNDAGPYTVTVTDAFACVTTDDFTVTIIDEPVAVITETHSALTYVFSSANSLNTGNNATYEWNFGDGNTSTLPNPTHIYAWTNPSSPASYTVTLEITNACGFASETFEIQPSLSVDEIDGNQLSIFPNPAENVLNIQFAQAVQDVDVRIMDMSGRVVASETNVSGTQMTMDVSVLSSGSYMVEIRSESSVAQSRLIVK